MTDTRSLRKDLMDEIENRSLGDKKFHSETSLQQFQNEDSPDSMEKDPGVLNASVQNGVRPEDTPARRRTVSQPGPVSGSMLTATAARAARRRPRVNYADDPERIEFGERQNSPKTLNFYRGDESGSATPIGDRSSPQPYSSYYRTGDSKSLNSYRLYAPMNDGRGAATPRKRSVVTMDAQSIRSVETHAPPPTAKKDNTRLTCKYLTLMMSSIYAILLVTLGLIFFLGSAIIGVDLSGIYLLILSSVGLIYHLYLVYDIGRYKSIALKNLKIKVEHDENVAEYFRKQEEEYGNITPGDRTPDLIKPTPALPPPVLIPLSHDYCFSQGRHSGSFFLKLGASAFALGHLVHSLLLIAVQIDFLIDDNIDNQDCVYIVQVVYDIINPLFSFLQLYFIFKYSNVIILRGQSLAHFGFMHMIGSCLCFWVSAIVRETLLALTLYANSVYGNGYGNETDYVATTNATPPIPPTGLFIDIANLYDQNCRGSPAISSIAENLSPYLYPFSVEYNILIVAVYYIIWSNIGNCDNDSDSKSDEHSALEDNGSICKIPTANEENDFTSNLVIYADCHASNRGLFVGMLMTVAVIGMLILAAVFSSFGDGFKEFGYLINDCTSLSLHIILLFTAVLAYNQTHKLDINEHPISLLDDILLFICLPAFFMETVFSIVATVNILNIVRTIDFSVMVLQAIIQTALLVDGLRRCSNSRKLRRAKPGRELLMFLIVANVAMWLFYTFSFKSTDSLDERYVFYGKVMWTILGHISLPLIMFYRFHSSVCFADIWDSAYKPGSEH